MSCWFSPLGFESLNYFQSRFHSQASPSFTTTHNLFLSCYCYHPSPLLSAITLSSTCFVYMQPFEQVIHEEIQFWIWVSTCNKETGKSILTFLTSYLMDSLILLKLGRGCSGHVCTLASPFRIASTSSVSLQRSRTPTTKSLHCIDNFL